MTQASGGSDLLSATHVVEYAYRRSLGEVLGAFFTGLREGRILGMRMRGGRVIVPPAEYDPESGEQASGELVEVGPGGVVRSWSWVTAPRPPRPLEVPFAWALIELDGADTSLLHAVDAGDDGRMSTGMRVVPRWQSEREGGILDIACFVPEDAA